MNIKSAMSKSSTEYKKWLAQWVKLVMSTMDITSRISTMANKFYDGDECNEYWPKRTQSVMNTLSAMTNEYSE